ncbi:hypothetical protein LTR75_001521 [Friedmanniomyces endolithicus]|nr:hypothetical protein LTR75_001521 [Friedmanniomyces endolithicus]
MSMKWATTQAARSEQISSNASTLAASDQAAWSATGQGVADQTFDAAVPINLTCPGADGSRYIDNKGKAYEVMCDTSFPAANATDMTSQPGASVQDCSNTCSNVTSCDVSTYSNGMCTYMNNRGSSGTHTPGRNSVVLLFERSGSTNAAGSTVMSTSTPSVVPTYSVSQSLEPMYSTPTVTASDVSSTQTTFDTSQSSTGVSNGQSSYDTGLSSSTTSMQVSSDGSQQMSSTTATGPSSVSASTSDFLSTASSLATSLPTSGSISNLASISASSGPSTFVSSATGSTSTVDFNSVPGNTSSLAAGLVPPASTTATDTVSSNSVLGNILSSASASMGPPSTTSTDLTFSTLFSPTSSAQTSAPTMALISPSLSASSSGSNGASVTSSSLPLATSTNLACNGTQQTYNYIDSTSGSLYTVQCNTTYSGVYSTTQQPDMASCISQCSSDPQCEAAAYDPSMGNCYEYNAEVPGSGVYSPKVQFAQRKVHAVVSSGVTMSYTITTVFTSSGINVQGGTTYTYQATPSSVAAGQLSSTSLGGIGASGSLSSTYSPPTGISTVQTLSSATVPTSAGATETAVSYSCPANDGQTISQNGLAYVLSCGGALSPGTSYAAAAAATSFDDCFGQCDQSSTTQGAMYCTGFTYIGATNGAGPGVCYLYNNVGEGFVAENSSAVGAIRLVNYVTGAIPTPSLPLGPSVSAPLSSSTADTLSPSGAVTSGTNTCSNGGNILNGCVVATVTPNPSSGASGGVGLNGASSSTIVGLTGSATVDVSASLAASLGVWASTGSSGISLGASPSAGLGLGATASASISGTAGSLGGSSSLRTTTVQSTTTITSCSSVLSGQLTCPGGGSNTLLASVSTATPAAGGATTVYIAFTTTVTTGAMLGVGDVFVHDYRCGHTLSISLPLGLALRLSLHLSLRYSFNLALRFKFRFRISLHLSRLMYYPARRGGNLRRPESTLHHHDQQQLAIRTIDNYYYKKHYTDLDFAQFAFVNCKEHLSRGRNLLGGTGMLSIVWWRSLEGRAWNQTVVDRLALTPLENLLPLREGVWRTARYGGEWI